MAFMRSNRFNADINQDLLSLVEGFQYDPYGVRATSGYRPGDSRQHGRGTAIDIELYDPQTQAALENYQDPTTFSAYQQYANALYQHALQTNPELAERLRWGGYFSGGKGKYGALDLMHFDVGGGAMGGGSWSGGLTPEQAALWGLQPGGGIGGGEGPVQPAANYGYTPEQRRAAIAAIESAGSGDYNALGAWTGDPADGRDRAYGRYQVMGSNIGPWAEQYLKQSGVTPEMFLASPELQDKLFDAVYGDYVSKYGERGAASKWFTGSEKEPERSDVHGKLTGRSYADEYMKALGAAPSTGASTSPAATGKEPAAATATIAKTGKWDKLGKAFQGGIGAIGKQEAPVLGQGGNAPQLPMTSPIPMESMPMIAGDGADQRDQLAFLMQRLNSGRLWG